MTGWDSGTNTYYINGVATTLNENGDGNWNGLFYLGGSLFTGLDGMTYFIEGVATPLNEDGDGWWNGFLYMGGVLFTGQNNGSYFKDGVLAHGWLSYDSGASYYYYIDGVQTYLDINGNGMYCNLYYEGGSLYTGGPNSGGNTLYWIDGVLAQGWLDTFGNYCYYIAGVQHGGLDQNGTGTSYVDSLYYYNGSLFTGWNVSYYYINGAQTTLDSSGNGGWGNNWYSSGVVLNGVDGSGNGYCTDNGIYYLMGLQTTLNYSGTGWWDLYSLYYINGQPLNGLNSSGTGYCTDDYYYYVNGVQTTLDQYGNGTWNDLYYESGNIFSGYSSYTYTYYLSGVSTYLSSDGTGPWNGLFYYQGSLFTGWETGTSVYCIEGVATTLDSSGNGIWNGNYYYAGVLSDFAGTWYWTGATYDGNWANAANWNNKKDGTGGNPTNAPWKTADTANHNVEPANSVLSNVGANQLTLGGWSGPQFTINGVCRGMTLTFYDSWIYGGTFVGCTINNYGSCLVGGLYASCTYVGYTNGYNSPVSIGSLYLEKGNIIANGVMIKGTDPAPTGHGFIPIQTGSDILGAGLL